MAGNRNSGRKCSQDVKMKVSYRLKLSTIANIEAIAEELGKTKSEVLQSAIDAFADSTKRLLGIE